MHARDKLQCNEFHRKGIFYPSEEIHCAAGSLSLKTSSKIVQSRDKVLVEDYEELEKRLTSTQDTRIMR